MAFLYSKLNCKSSFQSKKVKRCIIALCFLAVFSGCYKGFEPEPSSERGGLLPVAGAFNVRDLGQSGLTGAGGRAIRPGLLIRSGDLNLLTPRDQDFLFGTMGIQTVVDFRSTRLTVDSSQEMFLEVSSERSRAPSRLPAGVVVWDEGGPGASTAIDTSIIIPHTWDFIIQNELIFPDVATVNKMMITGYTDAINDPVARGAFRSFFDALLEAGGPVLFQCSAGKDRTGIASALVLLALGVPREDIIANFMLSAEFVAVKYYPVVPFIQRNVAEEMLAQRQLAQALDAGGIHEVNAREALTASVTRRVQAGAMEAMINPPGIPALMPLSVARATVSSAGFIASQAGAINGGVASAEAQIAPLLTMTEQYIRDFAHHAGIRIAPLVSVHRSWIEAAIDEVQNLGGIENYLTAHLGLPSDIIARLQALYLE